MSGGAWTDEQLEAGLRRLVDDMAEQEAAVAVLGVLGEKGGVEPGTFTKLLVEACLRADTYNLARLALGFPEIVRAVYAYKYERRGLAELQRLAGVISDG